jgi:bifunctional non-homologous end joining protein LigD
VLWRDERITRRGLAEYYVAVADVLLPHLRDRPFTLRRVFTVVGGPGDWVKDAPRELAGRVKAVALPAKSRGGAAVRYALVNDLPSLLAMLELGAVDLHVWQSRADRPERPDSVLFDLDPAAGAAFADVARAALLVREALDALGLVSVPRTSGGAGLHVLVPIERRATHEEARRFATAVARALERVHPRLVTTETARARRRGVYVDSKMNGHGQQVVASYSVRPLPGAPVATPLRWDEVDERLDPAAFTMDAVLARVRRHGDLAAPLLRPRQRLATALSRLRA